MPFRRGGSFRRRRSGFGLRPVNSMKNTVYVEASVGTTIATSTICNAVDSAVLATATEVERGCNIKAIWCSIDFCGLAATGVLQSTTVYLMKNPGANLTPPLPRSEGTSNEKKFIFKTWNQMTMRNQDGNPPYHWEGWVKIPRQYQRFGSNDTLSINTACTNAAGHFSGSFIYKWFK